MICCFILLSFFVISFLFIFFFFNDTATTEIYTLSLHDALPILIKREQDEDYHLVIADPSDPRITMIVESPNPHCADRSEEHTSELQSRRDLVCRLLLEKKKKKKQKTKKKKKKHKKHKTM